MRYMRWTWDELLATPMSIVSLVVEQLEADAKRRQQQASQHAAPARRR